MKQQEKQIMETVLTYVNHKQEFTRNASGLSPTAGLESDTEVTSLAACGDSETQGLPCHSAVVESEADKTQYHTGRTESSAENNLLFSAACEIDDKSDTGDHSDRQCPGESVRDARGAGPSIGRRCRRQGAGR